MIVSLSIAAALHAGVLFGFRRGSAPHVVPVKYMVPLTTFQNLKDEDPPEEKIANDEKKPVENLSPLKRSEDTPVINPDPHDFQQRIVPAVNVDRPTADLSGADFDPTHGVGDLARTELKLGDLDNIPRARVQIAPPYPMEAKTQGLVGHVLVEFVVDETGHVVNPRVVESTNSIFNDTTLRTLMRWRFEPGRKYGRNVRFRMALPLEFNLNEN